MNEPRRLLEQPLEGLAGELLRAGVGEQAPERTAERTLGVLGLRTGAIGASSAASAASGAAGSATTATGGSTALMIAAKWLGIGMGLGLVTATLAGRAFGPDPARSVVPHAVTPGGPAAVVRHVAPRHLPVIKRPETTRRAASPPLRIHATARPESSAASPVAPAGPASVAAFAPVPESPVSAETSSPPSAARLAREVALLDKVRAAVSARAWNRALGLLGRYDREFPHGALRPEARVLEVEALARSGNLRAATRIAQPILDRAPESLGAARIRRVLGLAGDATRER